MTKNIINFIATIIIALILSQFLPWWSIMVAAFATSLFISLKRASVFVVPFLAISLFWMVHAFWLSSANDFILAQKIAILLPLNGNAYLLILVTGIIGGLAAGISGIFGKQCVTLLSDR
ncbi:hypothetical protein [Bizionia arctica]|uniref:Uncharacterized protein n=1 Tax=Bizionia arctica TaxID=1495645 RepID=A0A917GBN1_9FLAO|nr:hypothetical protein [Bizionia arctica]GGG35994.1 hypothetical protein GCM10010976_04630 [Bizionia arctica]